MCHACQHIETNTKFILLMHPKEFKKVKNNTGHFTHLSLSNSELFIGVDFSNHKRINEIIATHESYILFPSKDALNLSKETPRSTQRELAIFIIDSTWACTKKIFTQSQNLQNLKHISFTTTKTSIYEIKKQPQENFLSTMESTLVVLEILNQKSIESLKKEQLEGFLDPFKEMIKYQKALIESPKSRAIRFKRH